MLWSFLHPIWPQAAILTILICTNMTERPTPDFKSTNSNFVKCIENNYAAQNYKVDHYSGRVVDQTRTFFVTKLDYDNS